MNYLTVKPEVEQICECGQNSLPYQAFIEIAKCSRCGNKVGAVEDKQEDLIKDEELKGYFYMCEYAAFILKLQEKFTITRKEL